MNDTVLTSGNCLLQCQVWYDQSVMIWSLAPGRTRDERVVIYHAYDWSIVISSELSLVKFKFSSLECLILESAANCTVEIKMETRQKKFKSLSHKYFCISNIFGRKACLGRGKYLEYDKQMSIWQAAHVIVTRNDANKSIKYCSRKI